jgi:succinate-semialdehyde dehydrogenase/glutarate-semialdehyde dehydrogenase
LTLVGVRDSVHLSDVRGRSCLRSQEVGNEVMLDDDRRYATVNPATGEHLRDFPYLRVDQLEVVLESAHQAFRTWRRQPASARAEVVGRAAELMQARKDELARLQTLEMGKPITDSEGEVAWVSDILRYFAEHGPGFLEPEVLPVAYGASTVVSEPLGVLLAIEPWNFPLYQAARVAGPQLVAGNVVLMKHSEICPQSALAIERLFRDAGAPDGVYTNIFLHHADVERVIAHDAVQGVTITGSDRSGAVVAEIAGRHLKKCVLELGGSDPFIILDLDALGGLTGTVAAAAAARLENAGQNCAAAKRIIVLDEFYEDVVDGLARHFAALHPGDPSDPATQLGPLSSRRAVDRLAHQVADAVAKGARVVTGGGRIEGPGAFFEPTVLTSVTPDMRAYHEELFGPVAVVYRVNDDEEAVALANSSPYGLGGHVYCSDLERARAVADQLETGMIAVNRSMDSQGDLPFGGVKRSGYGRELSRLGMLEFVNRRLVLV